MSCAQTEQPKPASEVCECESWLPATTAITYVIDKPMD